MKIGVTLPQFRPSADASLVAARAAETLGLDGVFLFDHVWAIGRPDRPALNAWPLLGALATETETVVLGTLVARVSLQPTAVIAHYFESLHRIVGERLVAGLGAGDKLSAAENEAVDVPFPPVAERLAELVDACRRVRELGIETWVGGLSARVRELARAEAHALNLWGVDPDEVAREVADEIAVGAKGIDVTWGGPVPPSADATADLLRRLRDAGATWAVCGPPYAAGADPTPAVEMLAEAATRLQ
jgi:alkanesulfonate monooxygenase SsuD/methylene tetrahydromethanopterin reductase-like flavin-dependent oxidoreductase (luciferase family)